MIKYYILSKNMIKLQGIWEESRRKSIIPSPNTSLHYHVRMGGVL